MRADDLREDRREERERREKREREFLDEAERSLLSGLVVTMRKF